MDADEPLLDVAAALADGTPVDWESASRSVTSEQDRRLLAELRFIADVARPLRGGSSGLVASAMPGAGSGRELDSPGTQLSPGDFWGPLKILEHVGRGTFGDVYRAWDSRLDREVALKVLRRTDAGDQTEASTVIHEGRLLAKVRHPNVVTVYGAERVEGRVGVWMEFVPGRTLEQQLREDGPFPVDRAITIGIELSRALVTVHRAGLIHRDVKAQNVLCDREQRLVLTDFGAGCELLETTDAATRELTGTPLYVAPEVLAGLPASPSSDVYSLGVLLYHVVTGTYPVRGRTLKDIRDAHSRGLRTSLATARPDLPDAFARTVDRALDPNPGVRFADPTAFGSELASLVEPAVSRSTQLPASGWLPIHRGQRVALVMLALVGAVSLWLAIGSRSIERPGASARAVDANAEIAQVEIVRLAEHGRLEEAHARALAARAAAPKSAAAACAVAYTLTYAGFLDDAVQAVEDVFAADPDYITSNAWWAPTALLYQQKLERFLDALRHVNTPSARLYRALAEIERGRGADAVPHLVGIEPSGPTVFSGLAQVLHGVLTQSGDAAAALRSIVEQRRSSGDRDGEVTFKVAQILSVGGDPQSALAALDDAVTQGFICVACFDASVLLEPVRAVPEYKDVRARALTRQIAFGQRFGLSAR